MARTESSIFLVSMTLATTLSWPQYHSICDSNYSSSSPQFFNVSTNSLICGSRRPITLAVVFNPNLQIDSSIPFEITCERKLCPAVNVTNRETPATEGYFISYLKINDTLVNQTNSVTIWCSSNGNSEGSRTSLITSIGNNSLNLTDSTNASKGRGFLDFPSPQFPAANSYSLCPSVTLASDKLHSTFGCFTKNTTDTNATNHSNVGYLKCKDWTNCQQLLTHKFESGLKTFCRPTWNESYCDNNPDNCKGLSIHETPGIIYCKVGFTAAICSHFFWKSDQMNVSSNSTYISTEIQEQSNELSLYTITTDPDPDANAERSIAFVCTTPRFIALGGFEWKWDIDGKMYKLGGSESCNMEIEKIDEAHIFAEKMVCKVPLNQTQWRVITVKCTVYFQSGMNTTKTRKYELNPVSVADTTSLPKGIASGIAACLAIILVLVLILSFRKIRRQKRQLEFSAEEVEKFMKGTALLNELSGNESQSATVLPYDLSLEIPRDRIQFEPILLGAGAFGKVMRARIRGKSVAIKTANKTVDGQYFRALLSELKIMTFVGKHSNIVELVGANTERIRKQDVLLMFEYCENGNALTFIRERREVFVDLLSHDFQEYRHGNSDVSVEYENGIRHKICSEHLIRWALEIATGMDFIASKNVYHGDIAARNILLSQHLIAKVGDFGLAKELKNYSLYVQRKECPLPLKWMSIEALRDLEFSIQSDVWSYGITLWELFSLGCNPYPGVEWNFQSWKRLKDGERMDRPSHATQAIHDILLRCWEAEPESRPSFAELKEMFTTELEKLSIKAAIETTEC